MSIGTNGWTRYLGFGAGGRPAAPRGQRLGHGARQQAHGASGNIRNTNNTVIIKKKTFEVSRELDIFT